MVAAVVEGTRARKAPNLSVVAKNDFTDLGNARNFAHTYAGKLRYVHGREQWLLWDGKRWKPDNKAGIMRYAKKFVNDLYRAAGVPGDVNFNEKQVKWAIQSANKTRIDAMIALARSEADIAIEQEDLDRDNLLLNCANGTVDLRTFQLRKHDPNDLITRLVNVDYDPSADCLNWLKFLETVFAGDWDTINFMQRAIGYSITGVIAEHVLFFCFGSGANGKSTFIEIIAELFAEHTARLRTEALMMREKSAIPADIATLAGARLCVADENEADQRWAENTVKQLTGGDQITARFMRQNFFTFTPTHHLWSVGNHKPMVKGTDNGMWRRMRLIHFKVTIPEEKRDPDLRDKLRREFPGILAWAVIGTAEWRQHGVGWSPAVEADTLEYRAEMDLIADIIEQCYERDEKAQLPVSEAWAAARKWMQDAGEERAISTQRKLSTLLLDRGWLKRKSHGREYWIGWKIAGVKTGEIPF